MPNETADRFNAMRWHDAQLRSLRFFRSPVDQEELVEVAVVFPDDEIGVARRVIFTDATYISLSVDLEGKGACSDAVSSAVCRDKSDWIASLAARNPHDTFEGFLHFRIEWIPPGGAIDVLAKGFQLVP